MSKKYISPEHAIRNIMVDPLEEGTIKVKPPKVVTPEVEAPKVEVPEVKPETQAPKNDTGEVKPETQAPKNDTGEVKPEGQKADADGKVKPEGEKADADGKVKPEAEKADGKTKVKRSGLGLLPFLLGAGGGGLTPGQGIGIGSDGTFGVPHYMHMASSRRPDLSATIHEDADEERKNIVNVPRPNSKRKETMTRNQEIKKKIIEENVKKKAIIKNAMKEYSVKINPELNKEKLNERNLFKSAAVKAAPLAGLGAGAYGSYTTGGVEASQRALDNTKQMDHPDEVQTNPERSGVAGFLDKLNPFYDKEEAKKGYQPLDMTLDAAQFVPTPWVSTPAGLAATYRDLQRGDYTDATLDFVGSVPFAGTVARWGGEGLKWLGKGINAIGDLTKAEKVAKTGASVVDTGQDIVKKADKAQPWLNLAAGTASGAELGQTARQVDQQVKQREELLKKYGPGTKLDDGRTIQDIQGYGSVIGDIGKQYGQGMQEFGTQADKWLMQKLNPRTGLPTK